MYKVNIGRKQVKGQNYVNKMQKVGYSNDRLVTSLQLIFKTDVKLQRREMTFLFSLPYSL